MATAFNLILMLVVLAIAAYAQYRIPFHSATQRQATLARIILAVVGIAVGWTAILWTGVDQPLVQLVAFFTGFGIVHIPAAFILWSKRLRGVHR